MGYEIKLSQTHPCHDVCDDLAGRYPKSFVWTGWHPMDRCYCVAILKTEEEFWRDGPEDSPGQSEREVTDVPQGFKDWVKDNRERIEAAEKRGTQPYFIRDNHRRIDEILKQGKSNQPSAEYAAHTLGKSGSKAIGGEVGRGVISRGITPKSDKTGFKALQKQTKSNAKGYSKEIRFDKNLFYTHRLVINRNALNDMVGHAYTADELKAIEILPSNLYKLTNYRYDPLKIARPNIRKKISSGAKHFVEYDIEIDGVEYILKTKAIKDSHGKFLIEYPYFFREKR